MIRILHLSDLHFGGSHFFPTNEHDAGAHDLADAIRAALDAEEPGQRIDAVVVSGDLLDNNQAKDFGLASGKLAKLCETLKVDRTRLFCVPGNHDVTWDADVVVKSKPFSKFHYYDHLMRDLERGELQRDRLPCVKVVPGSHDDKPLALALISSCELESPTMAGFGRVTETQIDALESAMRAQRVGRDTHALVAVLHHHLLPIAPIEPAYDPRDPEGGTPKPVSLTVDAPLVLRRLAKLGFTHVLHGHQHAVTRAKYTVSEPGQFSIEILGAGSAGATLKGGTRHFFVHEVDAGIVRSFSYAQAQENAAAFRREPVEEREDDGCTRDERVRVELVSRRTPQLPALRNQGRPDVSDLNYVFLSVVSCPEARRVFRTAMEKLRTSTRLQQALEISYFELEGMYDLLGRWDLVLRFRCSNVTKFTRGQLLKPLVDAKLIDDHASKIPSQGSAVGRKPSYFVFKKWVDVSEEFDFQSWLNHRPMQGRKPVHMRLKDTADYDAKRCQRGFIWVEQLEGGSAVEDALREALRMQPEATAIIESVAVAPPHAIVLELFSTCSQSSLVNTLNRAIEPVLADHKLQKFTLLSYGYDEVALTCGRRPPDDGQGSARPRRSA